VNTEFILPFSGVATLLVLLFWALRTRRVRPATLPEVAALEDPSRPHATYFGVIRQAMSGEDFTFLADRASSRLVRRAHKDRQRIAILYLLELRRDFQRLLRLARVIAVLSPELAPSHEFARLRLSMGFFWRYRLVLLGLYSGLLLLPQLSSLHQMVTDLAVRMDSAMKHLGERAAVAAELASTLNRRGLDMA
jgi:hypothetical protein